MGTIFRRTEKRPVPAVAEITEKNGKRYAKWKLRGKTITAEITTANGVDTVAVKSATYFAKFSDHTNKFVTRSTGCKDESTARQQLAKWEREAEQIRAGVLDATALQVARAATGPLEPLLTSYEQSLIARNVSTVYRANSMRAIRRLIDEVPLTSVKDLRREIVEPWFAKALQNGMKAETRNYYRNAVMQFANWLEEIGKLRAHDLAKLPKADKRADPVRPRRALTEDEFVRLLTATRTRPLTEARTVRRGERKGQQFAELRPEVVKHLERLGRERALIYQTFILTGLRLNELRTLTVGNLDLSPGCESLRLESRNEKNGAGSVLPIRADLAEELRLWIGEEQLTAADRLFTVPAGLRRILDRDLRAAGIPKRDERGRTIDVHAFRTTFATWLSAAEVAPRTAQAAMRHSDIKLTMGVYTDPAQLAVRAALAKLPAIAHQDRDQTRDQNRDQNRDHGNDLDGQNGSIAGNVQQNNKCESIEAQSRETPENINEKPSVTSGVTEGQGVERRRVELPASSLRTKRSRADKPRKRGKSAPVTEPVTKIVTTPTNPLPLLDLIQQLAALTPEHHAALAALLAPPTSRPTASAIDDLCPLDDHKEGAE